MRNWLLPEFLEDILPAEALRIERLRSEILEVFRVNGYQLVMPPMLEYVESLLTGTGRDMDLATFKLVDQLSGRHMGIRADMTPQVARIDAHLLNRSGINRLCYAGSVLHTLPASLTHTRQPLQVGAELYGHKSIESDIEVIKLMLTTLMAAGIKKVHLDIGHVGIFRALAKEGQISSDLEQSIFEALQSKDISSVSESTAGMEKVLREPLLKLSTLYGDRSVLEKARRLLPELPEIEVALNELETLANAISSDDVELSFDLAELTGYHYHTGIVFAAYAKGSAESIARGGRYDGIGKAFGRSRAATGFSINDLRQLVALLPAASLPGAILAPYDDDIELKILIQALRNNGEMVIVELPGTKTNPEELNCDRIVVQQENKWQVLPLQ